MFYSHLFASLLVHSQRGVLAVEVGQQLLAGAGGSRPHAADYPHVRVGVRILYRSHQNVCGLTKKMT